MKKSEFLTDLKHKISALPKDEVKEHISFYGEMIDDRIDSGLSEAEAVAEIGDIDSIAEQIIRNSGTSHAEPTDVDRPEKRRLKPAELALIILGFPLWFSLLVCAFATVLFLYTALCAVTISCWATLLSMGVCALLFSFVGPILIFAGKAAYGAIFIGSSMILAGFSILAFFGCKALTKGTVTLPKKTFGFITRKSRERRSES